MRGSVSAARITVQLHVGWAWALIRVVKCPRPRRLVTLLLLQDGFPIILDYRLVDALRSRSYREEVAEVIVVWGILEAESSHVLQVHRELFWETFAQLGNWGGLLLLSDLFVLLLISCRLQSLPRQTTPQEVHEDMAQCLQIIAPGLLASEMSVDAHVPCCSREGLPLAIWNVLLRFGVTVLFGHAKVHNMDDPFSLSLGVLLAQVVGEFSDQEIVGFDVAVN